MIKMIEETDTKTCQGAIFKAQVNHFLTKKEGFGFQVRLIPIKKLSCPGCIKCYWQSDDFSQVSNDWPIIGIDKCENGKLYKVSIYNESRDWETGFVDEWYLYLVEYEAKI